MTCPKTATTLPSFLMGILWTTMSLVHDPVTLIDFRDAGPGHDVHACVFHDLGTVLADLLLGIHVQELAIGFVEVGDDALGVCDEASIVDAVKDKAVHLQLAT